MRKSSESLMEVWTRDDSPCDWAIVQQTLAGALLTQAEAQEKTAGLALRKEAESLLEAVLEIFTDHIAPQFRVIPATSLARTRTDIGFFLEAPDLDGQLEHRLTTCRKALEEIPRRSFPRLWADLQDELARCLWDLADHTSGPEALMFLEQAEQSALAVLQVYPAGEFPQRNLAGQDFLFWVQEKLEDLRGPVNRES